MTSTAAHWIERGSRRCVRRPNLLRSLAGVSTSPDGDRRRREIASRGDAWFSPAVIENTLKRRTSKPVEEGRSVRRAVRRSTRRLREASAFRRRVAESHRSFERSQTFVSTRWTMIRAYRLYSGSDGQSVAIMLKLIERYSEDELRGRGWAATLKAMIPRTANR